MNILNIVNFVRGHEPRPNETQDLYSPVINQYRLLHEYGFKSTFLLQHDALINPEFTKLVLPDEITEVGVWLEMNRTLVTRAGGKWNGKPEWIWDWRSKAGLTIGYQPDIRKNIIDIVMSDFKSIYGFYPKTVAAWSIDAVSLKYLLDKYNISASMNCKEQWGTDGYSLWGGYYNQAFYPSKYNSFCPANSMETQIDVPIFRMLGSDPVDQYYCEEDENGQNVITLEPVFTGSNPNGEKWVKWFTGEIFNDKTLSFGYAQAGQENSFGWDRMEKGYLSQLKHFDELKKQGKIEIITVSEAGEWYKNQYSETPPSAVCAVKKNKTSVWYSCKNYRSNLYIENDRPFIRDLFLFDDKYPERYLDTTCTTSDMYYDNLPVIDSYRCSLREKKDGIYVTKNHCGLYFTENDKPISLIKKATVSTIENNAICVTMPFESENAIVTFTTDKIIIKTKHVMVYKWDMCSNAPILLQNRIKFTYNSYEYFVYFEKGTISLLENAIKIEPSGDEIVISF